MIRPAPRPHSRLVASLLRAGYAVRTPVRGASMAPALRPGDVVTLVPARPEDLRAGDLALVEPRGSAPRLHRVVGRAGVGTGGPRVRTRSDRHARLDPPAAADEVLGRVVRVEPRRGARPWSPRSPLARLRGTLAGLAGRLRRRRAGARPAPDQPLAPAAPAPASRGASTRCSHSSTGPSGDRDR